MNILTITSPFLNATQKAFYQNDQRKQLYKIRYKKKFLEYPYYSFKCKNQKVHAFLGPHSMSLLSQKIINVL